MSRNLTVLVMVAGLGLSLAHEALADAKNLSCISDESVHARKVDAFADGSVAQNSGMHSQTQSVVDGCAEGVPGGPGRTAGRRSARARSP